MKAVDAGECAAGGAEVKRVLGGGIRRENSEKQNSGHFDQNIQIEIDEEEEIANSFRG